ncbi:uncharacterized protein LOC100865977 [Apis florea]|uniref:uncharacterized protein LOC100865977 n=1 Tax=Apis florea TaxID=7463 RepID=UPI0012FEDDCA|nr:uncharacterized protein LOC100865977 [Apis florea]
MDDRREKSSHTATLTENNWNKEMYPNTVRYAKSANNYEQEYTNERDIQFPEERSSIETVTELEETATNKNNVQFHHYPEETTYAKPLPKYNTALRERYQRFNDYSEYRMPEALSAMQKLQKLKELQMKRDISERYYTQEIKRLIGEYYFGPKIASPSVRSAGRLQSSSFHPSSADRLKHNLEPCGTMTTITRLDCGCIQETTRPIFTTTKGRVQRRNCTLSQEEKLLKLISLNPQEHLFPSLEQPTKDRYRAKSKKRLNPRSHPKIPPAGDQEFEAENEKKAGEEPESEIVEHIPRASSPQQKFSDTSATSY